MYYRLNIPNKLIIPFYIIIIFLMIIISSTLHAQSLGDPLVKITFGSGTAVRGGALAADSGSTTYTYSAGANISEDYYTITNLVDGNVHSGFVTSYDHDYETTGKTNGYMMVVNGSLTAGTVFTRTVPGLCGNTQYQFGVWIKNVLSTSGIAPNMIFHIYAADGVTELGSGVSTGDVPTGNVWHNYVADFTLPAGTGTVIIKLVSNASGQVGNDFAVDDITFSPYGSTVSAVFNNGTATTATSCAGSGQTYTINATSILAGGYQQKLQMLINSVWTDQSTASSATSFTVTSSAIAGTYQYRLVSALAANISSANCVVSSNTLSITVLPSPTVAFSVPTNTCFGSPTTFTDQSTANNGNISNWLWTFGDGQTSTLQSPSHTYSATGNYAINLTVTNSNGCVATGTTQTIHIGAVPVALFAYSTPDCATNAVTFTDKSTTAEGAIISWLWNYGDGTTDTKTNNAAFQHTYPVAGTYAVNLTVTTNAGCVSSSNQSLLISPLPVVNFSTPDVCLADASALFTDSTMITDNSRLTYLWNFGDSNATVANPNTSTQQNPSHRYTKAAIYQVSLTVTSANGCVVNRTKIFTVNGSIPVAAYTVLNPTTLCSNREVFFVNNSTVDFGSVTKIVMYYDYGNNPTVAETDNDPYSGKLYRHTYPEFHTSPASKNYQVRMTAYSGGTCVSILDKTITLLAIPNLVFTKPAAVCKDGGTIQLSASESSGIAGTGVYLGTAVNTSGLFNPATAGVGTFNISYIYTAGNACADTVSQSVTVNPSPTVYAGADTTVLEGGSAMLHARATGDSLIYSWSPATYLSSNSVLDPIVTPTNDITYTLTVTTPKGCPASSTIKVSVLKNPLIPNTFTPNGDGINDTWNIKYLDSYAGAIVEVFNRYGQKVYYSIGYPVPWDGKHNNSDVPAGVYYYLINPLHGRKAFSGWVSVIR